MNLSSFLTSVGTSFLIFVILVLLFTFLSKKSGNAVIYYPNRILRGLDQNGNASRSFNPIGWVREALKSTEQDVISVSGVDTAVYFVFLSTMLGILVLSGLLLLPCLLPIAATGGATTKELGSPKNRSIDLDRLSMANIEAKSPRLWAFLAAVYWVSFVTYFMLWKAYNHVSEIRATALQSPEVKSEQFAIIVRDIPDAPEGYTRKEQVDSYFKTIYPDTFYRTMIVTDNKEVNKLSKELKGYKKKLARAEAAHAKSKATGGSDGTKPFHKTGCLGLVGAKVDSIEFYSKKISELRPKLESEQKTTLRDKQLPAAVVFFTSRVAAAAAAQSLHAQIVTHWTVDEAPEPRDIIWANLKIKFFHRQARQYIVYLIVALTILFYMIPIGLVSAFTTLENLRKRLPFLKAVLDIAAVKTLLGAFLPQLALLVFLAFLPKFLIFLSKAEGIPSLSHSVRAASGKYFYFSVLNVFIGVTIAGTLYKSLDQFVDDPKSIISLLAENIPRNSTFFLTFVALKFFVGYGMELSRIIPLIIFHIKKKFLCKTEDEIKEAWFPGDLKYHTRIPGDLLILTIIICYSVIAPLVIPFGAAYFAFGWLILRNQALKVYVPSYESDGRLWPHLFKRVMAALLLYQVTMFGYFGIKKFYFTPLLIPLPILSLVFIFICNKKFYRSFQDTALEVAVRELKETPNMERIFSSFIPENLGDEKQGNNQFEDAVTQVSRTGLVV